MQTHIVIIKKGENVGTYFVDNKCNLALLCILYRMLKALKHTHTNSLISRLDPSYSRLKQCLVDLSKSYSRLSPVLKRYQLSVLLAAIVNLSTLPVD